MTSGVIGSGSVHRQVTWSLRLEFWGLFKKDWKIWLILELHVGVVVAGNVDPFDGIGSFAIERGQIAPINE